MPGRQNWWVAPATYFVVLTAFVIYSVWSVIFAHSGYVAGPYLSPFYSPVINPSWWPLSSAILVAWVPLGFRATCYYYRKAYYRSFFWDPPACAIREPREVKRHYTGERRFPFVLNNFHRYFLYLAIVVLVILWIDTINAFHYTNGFYIGVGSLLMLVNVSLLTGYTLSCHALRHLVGGSVDCFSCVSAGNARHGAWKFVTQLNRFHGNFAWFSLFSVGITDMYIRLVSSGLFGAGCFGTHFGC